MGRSKTSALPKTMVEADKLCGEVAALVGRIQAALGTEEVGDALVEVAKNAHIAELILSVERRAKQDEPPDDDIADMARSMRRVAVALEKLTNDGENGYMELEWVIKRAMTAAIRGTRE